MEESIVFPALPTYLFALSPAGWMSLAVTVVLPLLAGLLMKQSWGTGVKGLILLALTSGKTLLEAAIAANDAATAFNWATALWTVVINFVIAVAIHFGVWRGTAVQRAAITSGVKDRRVIDGTAYPRRS